MRFTLILLWIVSLWGLLIIFSSSEFYSNASEPLVIKLTGLEEEWTRLLSSARLHNHSIRLNISNSVPTHYLLKSCHTIIWQSNEPTKTVVIEFTQPWIPALLKLASRCDPKNQFSIHAIDDSSSSNGFLAVHIYEV